MSITFLSEGILLQNNSNVNTLIDNTITGICINNYKVTMRQSALFFHIIYKLIKNKGRTVRLNHEDLSSILTCTTRNITKIIHKLEDLELITVKRVMCLKNNVPCTNNYYNINWETAYKHLGNAILGYACAYKQKFISQNIFPFLSPVKVPVSSSCLNFVPASNSDKPKGLYSSFSMKKVFEKQDQGSSKKFLPLKNVDVKDWLPTLKEKAIKDNLDDGKLEFHMQNIKNFYTDDTKCTLLSKLKEQGKEFMVNSNSFYSLFKKWVNKSLIKGQNEEQQEMAKKEKAKKLASEDVFLYESITGLECNLIRYFGKDSFVSWFAEKNPDTSRWRLRFPVEWSPSSEKWIMKVSPFYASVFNLPNFSYNLEKLNIRVESL